MTAEDERELHALRRIRDRLAWIQLFVFLTMAGVWFIAGVLLAYG